MQIFKAKMDTAYYDDTEAEEHEHCEVHIGDSVITVIYQDEDDTRVEYTGREQGEGHYVLESIHPAGKATQRCIACPEAKFSKAIGKKTASEVSGRYS